MNTGNKMIMSLALAIALGLSGCSQYRINDHDQFVVDTLPQKGDDCTAVMQAALQWRFDPHRLPKMPGEIHFQVTKALVLLSDQFVPRPDSASSKLWLSMHTIAIMPSGQRIEEDSIEDITGIWIQKKFIITGFDDYLPAPIDQAGAKEIYDNLSRPKPQASYLVDLHLASSLVVLLCSIPITTSGTVDLQYWQPMHDQALKRTDLLQEALNWTP